MMPWSHKVRIFAFATFHAWKRIVKLAGLTKRIGRAGGLSTLRSGDVNLKEKNEILNNTEAYQTVRGPPNRPMAKTHLLNKSQNVKCNYNSPLTGWLEEVKTERKGVERIFSMGRKDTDGVLSGKSLL